MLDNLFFDYWNPLVRLLEIDVFIEYAAGRARRGERLADVSLALRKSSYACSKSVRE